jgi:signal transduction histidine kinase
VNEELTQVAARGTKLLDVTTALSQARSVDDVTAVVLGKGLAVVEALRGILVSTEGAHIIVLGLRGMSPEFQARVHTDGRNADVAVTEAIRTNEEIWVESADEYRERYPWASAQLGPVDALCAIPLIHAGETIGGLAMGFRQPTAFGVSDRAFTRLLAQATAAALHRAWSYDAERRMRHDAELLARAREEVLGVVAHDLRNPLSLINGTTQLLLDEELPLERQKALLGVATRAAKQMNRLISDLLDAVRLQAGRLSLDVDDIAVDEVLHQTEETFQPIADKMHVRLDVVAPESSEVVRADPLRLSQIVGNLLGNALKFTPAQGRVTLYAKAQGDDVVFHVRDTGPGIPPEQMDHLFDKFWQARPTDHRGAGLGLAIARGLVEAHEGKIWVESAVGAGSTFAFTVPAARARDGSVGSVVPVVSVESVHPAA